MGSLLSVLDQPRDTNSRIIKVKIDLSFIADIQTHDGKELVNAAIGMAHALELKVVAEGVETEEQLAILKELGCDLAQGYLFSKPVCEEEFLALIYGQF